MQDQDITSVLKDLIRVSEDGKNGFAEAHDLAIDPELRTLFGRCATECDLAANELLQLSARYGGPARGGGSVSGALHQGWIKSKAGAEDTDIALLEEVERGQNRAKTSYLSALKVNLPGPVRPLILRHSKGALRNYELIRNLCDSHGADV